MQMVDENPGEFHMMIVVHIKVCLTMDNILLPNCLQSILPKYASTVVSEDSLQVC